jgi:aryl-phospho-beta-D-glucosidase BglC (GH1 family)
MKIRKLFLILCGIMFGFSFYGFAQPGQPVTDIKTFCSNQKGFNLFGKFDVSWSNSGFSQKEFAVVHDLGFNFVRLPLDYRTYTLAGNWDSFTETKLLNIDQAVQWGEQYNVHVCINLHRAPGYCVNTADNLPSNQKLNLWTDSVAQKAFVNHWKMFAERYKNISAERLSFNLVNEPTNVSETAYVLVMKKAIDAIHKITPNRLIFVDGLGYGRELVSRTWHSRFTVTTRFSLRITKPAGSTVLQTGQCRSGQSSRYPTFYMAPGKANSKVHSKFREILPLELKLL